MIGRTASGESREIFALPQQACRNEKRNPQGPVAICVNLAEMIYQAPGNFYASTQNTGHTKQTVLQHQARLQAAIGAIVQTQAGIHSLRQLSRDRQAKAGTARITIA